MEVLEIVGISSIVAIVVAFFFDLIKKRVDTKYQKMFTEKEGRYRSILVFMSVLLDVNNYCHISTDKIPDENDPKDIQEYYRDELKLHSEYAWLFASDQVIASIECFLQDPTQKNYRETTLAMRKDLWDKGW